MDKVCYFIIRTFKLLKNNKSTLLFHKTGFDCSVFFLFLFLNSNQLRELQGGGRRIKNKRIGKRRLGRIPVGSLKPIFIDDTLVFTKTHTSKTPSWTNVPNPSALDHDPAQTIVLVERYTLSSSTVTFR